MRPASGTEMGVARATGGLGSLTVDNGTEYDAIVKLVRDSRTQRSMYVRSKEKATMSNVSTGYYRIFFSTGKDLDPTTGQFQVDDSYSEFEQSLVFLETPKATSLEYSTYQITLQPVVGGNAKTRRLDKSAFINAGK